MKKYFAIVAIFLTSSLFGCVAVRPLGEANQLAVEKRVTLIQKSTHISIYKVGESHRGYGHVESFQISPGVHTITFVGSTSGYAIGTTIAEVKRTYDFVEGKTYVVQNAPLGGAFAVQIINQATGEELVPFGR
jgi:hypothetical protein